MRPLLKESFMFKVSKNAKISFFVKSKNLAVVRVTNELKVTYFRRKGVNCEILIFFVSNKSPGVQKLEKSICF